MLAVIEFISQPVVLVTSLVEVLSILTLISAFGMVYRHLECHYTGCHRLGRFGHEHLKLCHIHHPNVPNDGKISL